MIDINIQRSNTPVSVTSHQQLDSQYYQGTQYLVIAGTYCEMPDGRLICGSHGFIGCYKCCTDDAYMDKDEKNNKDDNGPEGNQPRIQHAEQKGTERQGQAFF